MLVTDEWKKCFVKNKKAKEKVQKQNISAFCFELLCLEFLREVIAMSLNTSIGPKLPRFVIVNKVMY